MGSLEGKVALVTGAGNKRSMGHQVALRLAREGAHLVVNDIYAVPKSLLPGDENWGGLDEVIKEINALNREALAVVADVSRSQDVDKMVSEILGKFGKIDILVHCAAIHGPMGTKVVDLDEEDFKRIQSVNVTGTFLISRAVARHMIKDGEGKKIVIFSSVAGTSGMPGIAGYVASKWGIIGLAKSLALELAPYHINVNIINPGMIFTNITDKHFAEMAEADGTTWDEAREKNHERANSRIPLGRLGTTEEVADLVSFLVSDQSNYITGQAISISGGD
ncbi:SDR family NAD(P)-dependent oxidoreductase [Chloroflexota bacterium]